MTWSTDIKAKVDQIFSSEWKVRSMRKVPTSRDFSPDNEAGTLQAVVLYADMDDSTKLVDRFGRTEPSFAASVYKAYLYSAATIIKNEGGCFYPDIQQSISR